MALEQLEVLPSSLKNKDPWMCSECPLGVIDTVDIPNPRVIFHPSSILDPAAGKPLKTHFAGFPIFP